jgi:hypothetical protein
MEARGNTSGNISQFLPTAIIPINTRSDDPVSMLQPLMDII